MRLSTKGRFAVNAMIDIALREVLGPVPLTDIASRQQISLSYLEQMFSKLRAKGLVTSTRGPGGGYALGRRIDDITVADIIYAVEDASLKSKQPDAAPAQDMTQDLWDAMNAKLLSFMQSVTLKRLVLDQRVLGGTIEKKPLPNRGVFKKPVQQTIRPNVPNSVFALGQTFRTP
ncbi:Rrf2 family transcriptional regulator [Rhodoferax sp.]|uniref:Rrf2 family transcriptional regulator n=1 Tax=Rhodoferax sp. TaxID=50421 RepID=UPI0008B69820|nr:Rrf2 family transcriptional regulator [Rhodoferax sp.]MDO8320470.1 Rrf2 family transcriptional regulator [Rhodoferax sp.]OGB50024.1 MAG: DNA-binding protein [Burkholderiales bacterium RIFOXYD12_FULL_59_19]OGB75793.1 MAG: DNA-binding protein [Burkholderiales bacterium RIFOXYC12_FULL_60_6]